MGFAADVAAERRPNQARCTVGIALDALPKSDRAEAVEVIRGAAAGATIARVLTAHTGVKVTGQTLNRHRRGDCTCELQ